MSFLFFLIILVLLLILSILSFGITIIRSILSLFFPSLRRSSNSPPFGTRSAYQSEQKTYEKNTSEKKHKIFDKSEGDYAEYEEMK